MVAHLLEHRHADERNSYMLQIETHPVQDEVDAPRPVPIMDRVRSAALVMTLLVGIPLTLAWFAFIGWLALWLLRSAATLL